MNIKIILPAFAALLAAGCTDLDVDVESQYTSYPTSEVAQQAELADVYYHLRSTWGCHYMEAQELSSDEWVGLSFSGDYYDAATFSHPTLHNYNYADPSIGWYDDVAAGITKANRAIAHMETIDTTGTNVASLRCMRAFYHFILMDSYGDVPILDRIPSVDDVIERQPRADVARFIESELLDILPKLPTDVSETTYGKPTKWMAEALLVKLYINWPVYTAADVTEYDASTAVNEKLDDVVKYCDEIINSGKFDLTEGAKSYRAKFYPDNGSQIKDFIYAMPYDAVTATGMIYGRPRTWRQGRGDGEGGPGYYGCKLPLSTGGNFSMTPECADRFTLEGDERNDVIVGGQIYMYDAATYEKTSTPYTYKGEPVVLTKEITLDSTNLEPQRLDCGANVKGWSQGYKSVKWFIIENDYKNDRYQSNDVPIFRYADILLEKAEAISRGAKATGGDTPKSLFNEIRSYVKAPLIDHEPSLDEILEERGRELFDENWRRNDMIRFGTFESEYGFHRRGFPTARFDKEVRIFPIPKSTLEKNTNWQQNAGY